MARHVRQRRTSVFEEVSVIENVFCIIQISTRTYGRPIPAAPQTRHGKFRQRRSGFGQVDSTLTNQKFRPRHSTGICD
jgi:hypothetical protein